MFGWELPPFHSGGLGMACLGLARALAKLGVEIVFVLPHRVDVSLPFGTLIFADDFLKSLSKDFRQAHKFSYSSGEAQLDFNALKIETFKNFSFGNTLLDEVFWYARAAELIAGQIDFDLIHAHDWLCFPAGLATKRQTKKPLILHVHATEFDRTGFGQVNQVVYEIEQLGAIGADGIVAVSERIKNILIEHYGIPASKIFSVHNGIDLDEFVSVENSLNENLLSLKRSGKKIVLYAGRLTLQKGVDYLIEAATGVLKYCPETVFVIAGTGDMEKQLIDRVAYLGIGQNFIFTGFYSREEAKRLFSLADVMVTPSVSEPFGIVPLEALANNVPLIVSKQSGVSEVVSHALKVDFWDVQEMSNQIIAILKLSPLSQTLQQEGFRQVQGQTWTRPAQKVKQIYESLLRTFR